MVRKRAFTPAVWVSGRAAGSELRLALRARARWQEIAISVPGVGFRPDGSMTVAQLPEEVAVLEQVMARGDADERGFELLDSDAVRVINPALRGDLLAGLYCRTDAVVEPRHALPALRAWLSGETARGDKSPKGYVFHGGRTAHAIGADAVVDETGERHAGDVVVVCPGAEHQGPIAELLHLAPVRPVQLQMLQTAPLGERLTTSVADGDSLRYYPAYAVPALADLPPQDPVAAEHHMQLLISQRADGQLTVGDTHAYDEPFDFATSAIPEAHLQARAASVLGRPLPPIVRRWTGVYSQCRDESICHRQQVEPGLWIVTGPGGRGMTLSPAIAEETLQKIGPP